VKIVSRQHPHTLVRQVQWLGGMACAIIAVLAPGHVFGLGSRIPNQDAAAIARGNAFVATADNPSAIYYNPAGITQLHGHNVQAGALSYLNVDVDYESPAGAHIQNHKDTIYVPQLHYIFAPKDKPVCFGLGMYAPFGLGVEWPDDAPFRDAGIEVRLNYITVNPVLAWRPLPTLSVGIGPTFVYTDIKLRQGAFPLPVPYEFRFKGDGWTYGFNAGILWKPHAKWSVGVKYFSATDVDYEGTASFEPGSPFLPTPSHTKAHLNFPQIVAAGVSFRPSTNWNIEVDIDWTDWNVVKDATIEGVGVIPLTWSSSFFYEFGLTRQLGNGYFVGVGYFFSEASMPDENYTPLVPDSDLHVGSLGVGYNGVRWTWAVAAQAIGGNYRNVDGAVNPTVNGRYRLFTPTLSISVGCRF
jgi:long-chain fatty acid transport protein